MIPHSDCPVIAPGGGRCSLRGKPDLIEGTLAMTNELLASICQVNAGSMSHKKGSSNLLLQIADTPADG